MDVDVEEKRLVKALLRLWITLPRFNDCVISHAPLGTGGMEEERDTNSTHPFHGQGDRTSDKLVPYAGLRTFQVGISSSKMAS